MLCMAECALVDRGYLRQLSFSFKDDIRESQGTGPLLLPGLLSGTSFGRWSL